MIPALNFQVSNSTWSQHYSCGEHACTAHASGADDVIAARRAVLSLF